MRKTGHDVDLAAMRRRFEDAREEAHPTPAKAKAAKAEENADFFQYYVQYGLQLARAGYLNDMDPSDVRKALRDALHYAQEMLDIAGVMSPIELRKYLGAALISNDPSLIKWLAQLPRDSYTVPAIKVSSAGYLLIQTLQAGALADAKRFAALQKEFAASITPKKLKVNPRSEKEIYEPLSVLFQSISAGDQSGFEEAWAAQAAAWKKRWSRPADRANSDAILDLETLGIGRIAQKFGLTVPPTNPYAPLDLLTTGKSA